MNEKGNNESQNNWNQYKQWAMQELVINVTVFLDVAFINTQRKETYCDGWSTLAKFFNEADL